VEAGLVGAGDGLGRRKRVPELDIQAPFYQNVAMAMHPTEPLLAVVVDHAIQLMVLDTEMLLGRAPERVSVHYATAKLVLVGDSGVGKTGLGWRMAHGEFKDHASTHGQQFWLLDELGQVRSDGAQCEAILWDLAGQPDYRLIHSLFLDDVDLALLLFDPTRLDDPLDGIEFWLKQLKATHVITAVPAPDRGCPAILVASRIDRGEGTFTRQELEAFCRQRGIHGPSFTSALRGDGVKELLKTMQALIPWDEKPATVTTDTFKRIKDHVLGLKQGERSQVIVALADLRRLIEEADPHAPVLEAEILTAVGHLANHGYVAWLTTSRGDRRILLVPELLNNLAASLVLEARRNDRGLGSLDEQHLLSGGYNLPELVDLSAGHRSRRERVRVSGRPHGIHRVLHPREPMAPRRPLPGGRRHDLRVPTGSGTRRRARPGPLLRR
jgi:small GTP-binding protein